MSLWWLEAGWKDATCAECGVNIWGAGGDPDHGVCPDCFFRRREQSQPYHEPTLEDYCDPHPYYGDDETGPRCYCGAMNVAVLHSVDATFYGRWGRND